MFDGMPVHQQWLWVAAAWGQLLLAYLFYWWYLQRQARALQRQLDAEPPTPEEITP